DESSRINACKAFGSKSDNDAFGVKEPRIVSVAVDHRIVPPGLGELGPEDGCDSAASGKDRMDILIFSVGREGEMVVGWPTLPRKKASHSRANFRVIKEADLREVVK